MHRSPETILEIDLNSLEHNFKVLRSRIRSETKLLGVVKAFAYGSDSVAIARKLEVLGADYLGVAYTSEGVHLRKAGIRMPILVLHPQPNGMEELIETCLEPSLYSPRILLEFIKTARAHKQRAYPVHMKFNTGLNRLGFWENDLEWIGGQINDTDVLEVRSLFSHLAASDDPDERNFTLGQIQKFEEIVKEWGERFEGQPFKHLLNTSGVFNYPEAQWDMVRTGIGLYGYSNDPATDPLLRPVSRLITQISQIHKIEPGEWVGYNKGYRAPHYRTTATLPIGHADGIGRQYGQGKGCVYIGGKPAPIIGNVCMDMTMVDISGLSCKEGDEVLFFGDGASAEGFASKANTISYELLAGISQRVPRVITGA